MLAKSPMYTPVNPKEQGWSGDKVLEWQWTPLNVLYDYIDAVETNAITYTNELIAQINTNQTDIASLEESKVNKAGDTMTGNLAFTSGAKVSVTNGVVTSFMESAVIGVVKDSNTNLFSKMTYGGLDVSLATGDKTHYGANVIQNRVSSTTYTLTLPTKTGTFALVSDVTVLDEDLQNQIDIGNSINITTLGLVATNITDNGITYTIQAKNDSNEVRSQFYIAIPQANTLQAGLLNSTDKGKINAIANDIATALSSANNYTDSKVARSNLVNVLGEATTALNGLMSAEDKSRLDVLYALLGEGGDDDTIVDTIREVLEIFENYPEGADLVNALSLKINYTDIVDNLTSYDTNKPLSANQGRVLKGQIDNIVNGTTIVGKANMDSAGNVIKDTYFNREDGFAVGLVSVTEYDEDTGEVTLEYNSSAVTNIAYDTNTGVITFTY